MSSDFMSGVWTVINGIWLTIDAIIYSFITFLYQVFLMLARAEIFTTEMIENFTQKVYLIVGVVMLFVIAYSLLMWMINPDGSGEKGAASPSKFVGDILKALVLMALVPSIFRFAYTLQNTIIDENIIGKLILGVTSSQSFEVEQNDIKTYGQILAAESFQAFFYPAQGYDAETIEKPGEATNEGSGTFTLADALLRVQQTGNFHLLRDYAQNVTSGQITYMWLISSAAGVFLLYVIFSFCLDLGVRAVKLGFMQLMAPVPIMSLILPGSKGKEIFNSWVKKTLSYYAEVFIRIVIVFLGLFLISNISSIWDNLMSVTDGYNLSFGVPVVVKVLLIMGIVAFMRQAPKLISELFGLNGDGIKLGIGEKLADGGALMAAGLAGSAITGLGRNAVNAYKNGRAKWNEAKKLEKGQGRGKAMAGAFFGTAGNMLRSGAAGTVSGAARGAWRNKGSRSFSDLKTNTAAANTATTDARRNREIFNANRESGAYGAAGKLPIIGAALAHGQDFRDGVGRHFGAGESAEALDQKKSIYDKLFSTSKGTTDILANKEQWKKAEEEQGTARGNYIGKYSDQERKTFEKDWSPAYADNLSKVRSEEAQRIMTARSEGRDVTRRSDDELEAIAKNRTAKSLNISDIDGISSAYQEVLNKDALMKGVEQSLIKAKTGDLMTNMGILQAQLTVNKDEFNDLMQQADFKRLYDDIEKKSDGTFVEYEYKSTADLTGDELKAAEEHNEKVYKQAEAIFRLMDGTKGKIFKRMQGEIEAKKTLLGEKKKAEEKK